MELQVKRTPKYNGQVQAEEERSSSNKVKVDMNPMVDLAFLLLTFFMLATTFSKPQALEVVMPLDPKEEEPESQQPVKESKALMLVLGEDNELYWYQGITDPDLEVTNYSSQGIRQLLLDKKTEVEGLMVLIKPHPQSTFENLVDILDEMSSTEMERYAIVDFETMDQELIDQYAAN